MSVLGDLFTQLTGVTPKRAGEFVLAKAREALRERVCHCGHISKQHADETGACRGSFNEEPCNCAAFLSLAERDRQKAAHG